jgi:hypothetical protein
MTAYKFVKWDVPPQPDLLKDRTEQEFIRQQFNGSKSGWVYDLMRTGAIRLGGYAFLFELPHFVVKQHGEWNEYRAPNKTLLRRSLYGRVDRIVAV